MIGVNLAKQHAKVLQEINHGFETSKIIFQNNELVFETDAFSSWIIKREDNFVHITPKDGINSFNVRIRKNAIEQELDIPVFPDTIVNKFRTRDLTYFIAECFDFENHKPDGDLTEGEQVKFFELSIRYLEFLGHNPYELMDDIDPKQISSVVSADLLYENVKSCLLKFKDKQTALDEIVKVLLEYEELNKVDKFNREKLTYILDSAEKIADRYI